MTAAARKPGHEAVILCVDDEQDLLRDIIEELTEAGYGTLEAANGDEALALLHDHRPDLILCDISMPGLDGFGLLQEMLARGPEYADIPFVFLTALSDPREIAEGKRFGADDYLVKPIDHDLMLATVEARLRQIDRIHGAYRNNARHIDVDALCARFRLTPAEARVAIALTEGRQPAEIAQRFHVARTTVAFHMRNLFTKTGTRRQAELVALLLRPPLSGE